MTNIEKAAVVFRKYSLGSYNDFQKTFVKRNEKKLKKAFDLSLTKIYHREIIKDSIDLSFEDSKKVEEQLKTIGTKNILFRLNDNVNITKLSFNEENIERRLRHILAKRYISALIKEEEKLEKRKEYLIVVLFLLIVLALFNFNRIKQGLTPIDTLANQLHEKSKYEFSGAICNDSWTSHSQGQGTCSWHGGVDYYFYVGDYSKSIEECQEEARKISWIGE